MTKARKAPAGAEPPAPSIDQQLLNIRINANQQLMSSLARIAHDDIPMGMLREVANIIPGIVDAVSNVYDPKNAKTQ